MKTGWVFLFAGIFLIAVGLAWIITGSPGPALVPYNFTPVSPTPTPTPPLTPPVTPTVVPVTTPTPSADEIKLHFMDLAFGAGNAALERVNATSHNGRIIIGVTANNDADTDLLVDTARQFNSLSQTNQISEQIKQASDGDITIKFIPAGGMDAIVLNTSAGLTTRVFTYDNLTTAKIAPGTVYINGSLGGDVRNHTLVRSLYYELGFVGDTQIYPDSLFFGGENTNTGLSYADQKAVTIMYGPGLAQGMTQDQVRQAIFLR